MDSRIDYQKTIKRILSEYAQYTPVNGEIASRMNFDDEHGSYALFQVGWNGDEYVHGTIIHIDLIGDKFWVQYDGTEKGIATELVAAGIPKDAIVLGFRPPEIRPFTGFAVI